jgi:hypothetical protein
VLRFDCFAGNGVVAAGEEKEEGRKLLQTHLLPGISCGCAWKDAPPLFLRPENFLDTVPACRSCSL